MICSPLFMVCSSPIQTSEGHSRTHLLISQFVNKSAICAPENWTQIILLYCYFHTRMFPLRTKRTNNLVEHRNKLHKKIRMRTEGDNERLDSRPITEHFVKEHKNYLCQNLISSAAYECSGRWRFGYGCQNPKLRDSLGYGCENYASGKRKIKFSRQYFESPERVEPLQQIGVNRAEWKRTHIHSDRKQEDMYLSLIAQSGYRGEENRLKAGRNHKGKNTQNKFVKNHPSNALFLNDHRLSDYGHADTECFHLMDRQFRPRTKLPNNAKMAKKYQQNFSRGEPRVKPRQNQRVLRHEEVSIKGSKSSNQDYVKCGNDIFIVCDGHGDNGHQVSEFVAEMLYEMCAEEHLKRNVTRISLKNIFTQVESMLQNSKIDLRLSGSTCTLIIHFDGILYCANVGDSPALLLTDEVKAYSFISTEHKPDRLEEKERIEFYGGIVRKHPCRENTKSSPLRLWGSKEDNWGPGLAVSRAFGDQMAQKYGLISEPSVSQFAIEEHHKYVVIGSDGLFDKIPASQIEYLVNRQAACSDRKDKSICELLSKVSKRRWGNYSDDISAVIIYL